MITNEWKDGNYAFVGKAFQYTYANRIKKLLPIIGEETGNSVDYEISGSGGFGEMEKYDGSNLNQGKESRGFKAIITPEEYTKTATVGYKEAKVDKSGECRKAGVKLGNSASLTVYLHVLRLFAHAFNPAYTGGDGKAFAATDHPVASKGSEGRKRIVDPDSGTYSNLITDALSVSAITAAQAKANRFITPDGAPFLCDMDTVVVSPELEATAKKLFGENSRLMPTMEPEADNHSANPIYGMKYIVLGGGNDGFTAKQWALCDSTLMKELVKIYYITKPEVLGGSLENPLIDPYTAYADFGVGWGDARQIIFSNPA